MEEVKDVNTEEVIQTPDAEAGSSPEVPAEEGRIPYGRLRRRLMKRTITKAC